MAFIDFTNGEVLTADQMDTVMRQSVMKFADATARDTALSAVLAEGMMCYLDDTNEVLKYDGASWVAVGGASPITTEGDLIIGDASGEDSRLAIGAADTVLTSNGTTATWVASSGGGELYAAGNHTISKAAGYYQIEATEPATVNSTVSITSGINNLPTITSLEVPEVGVDFFKQNLPVDAYTSLDLQGITFGNGLFVAVGESATILTSPDGHFWTRITAVGTERFYSVAFGAGLFVVVGDNNDVRTSPDGITWTARDGGFGTDTIDDVAFGDNGFVAVGRSFSSGGTGISLSADGITWSQVSNPSTGSLRAVTFGDGLYVAAGQNPEVLTSSNGVSWSATAVAVTDQIYNLDYLNGEFWLFEDSSTDALVSSDGTTYTSQTVFVTNFQRYVGIAFGDGLYIAMADSGEIATSTDGTSWTQVFPPFFSFSGADAAVFAQDKFVFAGKNGEIVVSQDGLVSITELPTPITP